MTKLIKISEVDEDDLIEVHFMAIPHDASGALRPFFFATAKAATEWGIDHLTMNSNIINVRVFGTELWAQIEKAEDNNE